MLAISCTYLPAMMVGTYGAVFLHQLHVGVVHEGAVFDRIDAGDHRAPDRFSAMGVGGDGEAVIVGGGDDRHDFLDGHLRVVDAAALVEHAARGHDLDDVDAVLVVLADRLVGVVDAVDDAVLRAGVALQVGAITVGVVGVAARGADCATGGEDARSGDDAGIDGVAQGDRGVGAIAEVAHGSETGHQRPVRVDGRANGVVGGIQVELVDVAGRAGLAGEMGMAVDQAGQAGGAAELDGLGTGDVEAACADLLDALAFGDHGGFAEQAAGDGIDQMATVEDNGRRSRGSGGFGGGGGCGGERQQGWQRSGGTCWWFPGVKGRCWHIPCPAMYRNPGDLHDARAALR